MVNSKFNPGSCFLIDRKSHNRYSGYDKGFSRKISAGDTSFPELEAFVLDNGEPAPISRRQGMIENISRSYFS